MKKLFGIFLMLVAILTLASCGGKKGNNTKDPIQLATPTLSLTENVVSWDEIENASGYVVKVNSVAQDVQTQTTYTLPEVGSYEVCVKAVTNDETSYKNSPYSESVTYEYYITNTTLWVLGDSTSCSFANEAADQIKYYPRYGFGTQLSNYLDDKVTVRNIAVSGRSAGNYFNESTSMTYYAEYKSEIKAGDYVIIAFGHNDQNGDVRYSNPNLASDDTTTRKWTGLDEKNYAGGEVERPVSFKYLLNHYYIEVAQEAGATPILCTPIVRRNGSSDTLSEANCHVWSGKAAADGEEAYIGGDYAEAIRELAAEKNITLIDNTAITKAKYESIGKDKTLYMHAWVNSKEGSVDNTHLNIFGAKWVAYSLLQALKNTNCNLKKYIKSDITEPTQQNDLVVNPNYVDKSYEAPTSGMSIFETTNPWCASAFGYLGGKPTTSNYVLTEESSKVTLQVKNNKGKIADNSDGIFMYYQQIAATSNFTLTAKMKITQYDSNTQVGMGIMIRDDMYVDVDSANDSSINSNYVAAGSAITGALSITSTAMRKDTIIKDYKGTAVAFELNTNVTLTIVKNGNTYTVTYGTLDPVEYEVDLTDIDKNYVYAGFYVARNATVEFSNYSITMN